MVRKRPGSSRWQRLRSQASEDGHQAGSRRETAAAGSSATEEIIKR